MCWGNKESSSTDGAATRPNAWEWQCGMCTLINRPSFSTCEMCGFPRGTRSSGEAKPAQKPKQMSEPAMPKGRTAPSAWHSAPSPCRTAVPLRDTSAQSPGQQILASLKQKADSPELQPRRGLCLTPEAGSPCSTAASDFLLEPARVDAGNEILAALRCGGDHVWMGGQRQTLDPSQELLATLKSGGVVKPGPDSSQQLLAVLKSGGDVPVRGLGTDLWTVVDGHSELIRPKRKAARKGRRGAGGGDRPVYSQAA